VSEAEPRRVHRLVRTNHLVRSTAFAFMFVVTGIHLWERGYGAAVWLLLALQFLAYPHLVYLRARGAQEPRRIELANLDIDSVLLGVWSAALGWPAGIAYALFFGTTLNGAANRGAWGIARAGGLFALGALVAAVATGFRYEPTTSLAVLLLGVAGSLVYMMLVGVVVYRQNLRLRDARRAMARDVAELRRRDEQLSISARALESMSEAVMITSADGTIVSVNKAFGAITGYNAQDTVGRPESEFRSGMQPEAFYVEAYATVQRDGQWSASSWSRRKNGTLYRELRNLSAVRDESGKILFFVSVFFEIEAEGARRSSSAA
jgi:PAS domain S-box-containing protein